MDKAELIQHLKDRDEIGIAYVKMQLDFRKWMIKKILEEE